MGNDEGASGKDKKGVKVKMYIHRYTNRRGPGKVEKEEFCEADGTD